MALWSSALVGSTPIGAPVVGAVSDALDPRAAIALGALGCVAAGAVSLAGPGKLLPERDVQSDAVEDPARHETPLPAGAADHNRK
jgi:hypothetical protein